MNILKNVICFPASIFNCLLFSDWFQWLHITMYNWWWRILQDLLCYCPQPLRWCSVCAAVCLSAANTRNKICPLLPKAWEQGANMNVAVFFSWNVSTWSNSNVFKNFSFFFSVCLNPLFCVERDTRPQTETKPWRYLHASSWSTPDYKPGWSRTS